MAVAIRRVAAVLATVLSAAGLAPAQNADSGLYVSVPNPLTSSDIAKVKNRVEGARQNPDRRPTTIIFDFNPGEKDATAPDFGVGYELADYIATKLHDTTTVAYVHKKVSGHAVLPVLACQQIVCGPQGALGEVVPPGEPPLTGFRAEGYVTIVGQSRPAFVAVARKMYDPGVQLRRGQKGGAEVFVDLRDRAKFTTEGIRLTDTAPLPAAPDMRVGLFQAPQLRELGLSKLTVETRQDLLDAYGLTAAALREDPADSRPALGVRLVLRGALDIGTKESVVRTVRGAVNDRATILFLQLECAGGDLQAARDLAEELRTIGEEGDIRLVAFVPDKAPDSAAIIALGCSEIVMSRRKDATTAGGDPAPEAEFGDFDAALAKGGPIAQNVDFWVTSLRGLAEAQGYPPILVEGMLRRDLVIVRVLDKARNVRRLMAESELKADPNRGDWVVESTIKSKGQLLTLSASRAEELGLVRYVVETRDPTEVYAKYGLDPARVREAVPSVFDRFAEFLKLPVVTVLLVVIGFTGLILELKVPGTTVPGILAALCFILVFWAHTQFSGHVAVLAGLLFILGLILVLLEVFVLPGVGVAGISGVLLMLAALGLATFGGGDGLPSTTGEWGRFGAKIAQYLVGMIAATVLAFVIARYLPSIPYANRLMLVPPGEKPGAEAEVVLPGAAQAAGLLGAVGTSVTVLRPAGTVRFGDQFVDVVTEGGYIPAGARIQVVEVEGTRIVVKEV